MRSHGVSFYRLHRIPEDTSQEERSPWTYPDSGLDPEPLQNPSLQYVFLQTDILKQIKVS